MAAARRASKSSTRGAASRRVNLSSQSYGSPEFDWSALATVVLVLCIIFPYRTMTLLDVYLILLALGTILLHIPWLDHQKSKSSWIPWQKLSWSRQLLSVCLYGLAVLFVFLKFVDIWGA